MLSVVKVSTKPLGILVSLSLASLQSSAKDIHGRESVNGQFAMPVYKEDYDASCIMYSTLH